MNQLKPGYERISQHIAHLARCPWLSESQKFWPRFLFHFTDIRNAKNILTSGCLFSRQQLLKLGQLKFDIASPGIINATQDKWKNYVRLYFRPRTPMQYSIEGIRPKDKLKHDAHCPVPVVFVFDANEILSLHSTSFSNGNLAASGVEVSDTVDFYLSLPFEKIYHDTGWGKSDGIQIKIHRQAEVIVPGTLKLSQLKYIVCRSQAEFETLIHLLPSESLKKWRDKIRLKKDGFFFSDCSYVEQVHLSSTFIKLSFNSLSKSKAEYSYPFHARLEIEEIKTGKRYTWEDQQFNIPETYDFDLSTLAHPDRYIVSFFLDGNLAYRNTYIDQPEILF